MSKKYIILLLLPICVIVIYIAKNPQKPNAISSPIPLALSPTPTLPAESSISFIPNTIYTPAGQNNEVNIQLNSQGKYPTGVQLELAYDPTILTGITLTPGAIFANPNILLDNNDEKLGRISYALSLDTNEKPRYFSATAAIMKFNVKGNTLQNQTSIYFLPKTSIMSSEGIIPLKIAYGLKILINPVASASPILR